MSCLLQLALDSNEAIKFEIPEKEFKNNLYYEPTQKLNQFDIIKIFLEKPSGSLQLFEDILQEGLLPLIEVLRQFVLKKQESLSIVPGDLGRLYNMDVFFESYKISPETIVWSHKSIITFLYNVDNEIYLEIAKSYPWHLSDSKQADNFITFDEFIKDYRPCFVKKMDLDLIQSWIRQCERLEKKTL